MHRSLVLRRVVVLAAACVLAWPPAAPAQSGGRADLDAVEARRTALAEWIVEYSPITHVTADDPPVGLYYRGVAGARVGEEHPDPTHSPILGRKLAESLEAAGIETAFQATGAPHAEYPSPAAFLIGHLQP